MTETGTGHDDDRIHRFLRRCADRLTVRAASPGSAPEAPAGAAAFARALAASSPRPFDPGWQQALDTIDLVEPDGLGPAFTEVAPLLPWTPTTRSDDGGVDFALAPLETVRDLGDLTVGLMYVRPDRQYPLHRHAPQELYLTLAGHGQWRYGGHEGFRPVGPDATLYNHPHDLHSAIAGERPLVALYVLWP